MAQQTADLESLRYDPRTHAMMLDFDGTLVDIAPTPDAVVFTPQDAAMLGALSALHGGALAIVSGRAIDDLDGYLGNYSGPLAGGHGAEIRVDGQRHLASGIDTDGLERIKAKVRDFVSADERILLEEKATGTVMHFRKHPQCEKAVTDFAGELVERTDGFELQFAKMAVEIRPSGVSKAQSMEQLVRNAPFTGRKPFFAGDDVTDEDAFGWVAQQGGISVRIGPGDTTAHFRTASPDSFKAWLSGVLLSGEGYA